MEWLDALEERIKKESPKATGVENADLESRERAWGVRLPEDYRNYLQRLGGQELFLPGTTMARLASFNEIAPVDEVVAKTFSEDRRGQLLDDSSLFCIGDWCIWSYGYLLRMEDSDRSLSGGFFADYPSLTKSGIQLGRITLIARSFSDWIKAYLENPELIDPGEPLVR